MRSPLPPSMITMRHLARANPVSKIENKLVLAAVALGGLAALYYVFKPAATSSPPPPIPPAPVDIGGGGYSQPGGGLPSLSA